MTYYRRNEILISDEVRFYLTLRRKELTPADGNALTIDEVANGDLRNFLTSANPSWVLKWDAREKLRARHKAELKALEYEENTTQENQP